MMLDEHLDPAESRLYQVVSKNREASGPGSSLGGRGGPTGVVTHLLRDPLAQVVAPREREQTIGGMA